MKNELLHLGPFTLYGYGTMIALGILAAYCLASHLCKKKSLREDFLLSLVFVALLSGFGGAKLLFWICQAQEIAKDPSFLLETLGDGFVVYGGILGGILGCFLFCKSKGGSFLTWFDLLMPPVALAQGFGRLGCLLAGCCYGKETASPFHLVFEDSFFAPSGIPLVPTQVYSSLLNLANMAILLWVGGRERKPGRIAALYLINYSIGRFCLEFLRGDMERGFIGALSVSQILALFTLLAGLYTYALK